MSNATAIMPPHPADETRQQRAESADSLREQAAACRRLSIQARTRQGVRALEALGDHFDEQARKIDPASLKK